MKNTKEKFNDYRKRYAEIRVRLENEDFVDMNDFSNRNNIDLDTDYYNIIRAGINRPKIFVKRESSEKWHKPFNPFMLNIVHSNIDFQFITEEYSCAAYVVEYVNNTNRGVSDLQRKIIETMNEHPEFDIIDVTQNISVNIINHNEITCQEAAWYLLHEPMSKCSTLIVYIPAVWPIERQRIRKTMKELSESEDDCTDGWKENWFHNCQVIYSQFGLAIHQNDHQARRRFIEWAQNEIAVVPDFHKRILFSDEAHFWLNGYFNKQNCRIWSEDNPQVYVETPLHPEKLTVWCALWAGRILLQKR
ncbi:helitron_like_N domain-containing protein [Trichonephila clavipes]|uniref:Helitron_like_N domain-containing protein n=1 Tax=Trichonephila clavipes TaxID=2585209 RepID=A0A8X6VVP4_TRICX|nr:helitron_like_N domain-containing protein [Trichonephila clavipes]